MANLFDLPDELWGEIFAYERRGALCDLLPRLPPRPCPRLPLSLQGGNHPFKVSRNLSTFNFETFFRNRSDCRRENAHGAKEAAERSQVAEGIKKGAHPILADAWLSTPFLPVFPLLC